MNQLHEYLELNGETITVDGKSFTVSDMSGDAHNAVATFNCQGVRYTGWLYRVVPGYKGKEVWLVMNGTHQIAAFVATRRSLTAITVN
jgi:hypothetical protein